MLFLHDVLDLNVCSAASLERDSDCAAVLVQLDACDRMPHVAVYAVYPVQAECKRAHCVVTGARCKQVIHDKHAEHT